MASFHPIVVLPANYFVHDFTGAGDALPTSRFSVGRYNEDRVIYTHALFGGNERRTVHLGLDLGAPAGTAVHAPTEGTVVYAGRHEAEGDYGPTLVVRHGSFWVLYGHLDLESLRRSPVGTRLEPGDVLGHIGCEDINGGWPPHVHVQLSIEDPGTYDMPGVCDRREREAMLTRYPNPAYFVGELY